MRSRRPSRAWAAMGLAFVLAATTAGADAPVAIVVLKEHGAGNQALAQPYLDKMAALAAQQNGWPGGANGKYFTNRASAETFIKAESPHYGILSLPAFLALRAPYQLQVIGRVTVSLAGGRRYYLISKTATDLAGCKGKTLATDHGDDPRFIDRVASGGRFTLADFTLVPTQRPLQTTRAVLNDQAVCALIDDAQKDQLDHLESKDGVHSVWESAELPPMVVVAFPAASASERTAFKRNLAALCAESGKSACAEVGIDELTVAADGDYAGAVAAYGK